MSSLTTNDSTAKYYDLVYKDIKGGDVIVEEIKLIKSLVAKGAEILDVGCGTGRHAIPLAEDSYKITAIDKSQGMLKIFRNKIVHLEKNQPEIILGDIVDVDFSHKSFDLAILMWNTLFEIALTKQNLLNLFKKLISILKNEGKILINIDNTKNVDPSKIDSKLVSNNNNLKLEGYYSVKNFNPRTNTIILTEKIKIYDHNNNLIDEQVENIKQRWWTLEQLQNIASKLDLELNIQVLNINEELYIVFSTK